jgi:hypothetical protein
MNQVLQVRTQLSPRPRPSHDCLHPRPVSLRRGKSQGRCGGYDLPSSKIQNPGCKTRNPKAWPPHELQPAMLHPPILVCFECMYVCLFVCLFVCVIYIYIAEKLDAQPWNLQLDVLPQVENEITRGLC